MNFKSKINPKDIFAHNFCLQSIYLVEKNQTISTPNKQNRYFDK